MKTISPVKRIMAGAAGILLAGAAQAVTPMVVVADSVADYSGVQGQGNWFYGYFDGPFTSSDFTPLPIFLPGPNYWLLDPNPNAPPWTAFTDVGAHADAPVSGGAFRWAVRRWVSEVSGPVDISGRIAKINPAAGDGITARILVDGSEIHAVSVHASDTVGVSYRLTPTLAIGSKLDFVLDADGPGAGVNDFADYSRFTAVVQVPVPEPGEWAMLLAGLGMMGVMAKRRMGQG